MLIIVQREEKKSLFLLILSR